MTPGVQRQSALPIRATTALAWKMMTARAGRALLVALSVAVAVAFFQNVALKERLELNLPERASNALISSLQERGELLSAADQTDARLRARWLLAIALLIAFVGIVNALAMSVIERAGEIGTLKCLGATHRTILSLYLIEGLLLGALGSAVGVAAGATLAVAESASRYGRETFQLIAPGEIAALAAVTFGLGVILAVAGAVYPAWRAARLDPAEALRANL